MFIDYINNSVLAPFKEKIRMFMENNEPKQLFSSASEGEFADVRNKALKMGEIWKDFYQQINQPNSPYADEFRGYNVQFTQALDKLLTDLRTPTLTLATTGTTSSGKSTLVNLLCGADIMPRMAGEMSAGIVTIKHAADGTRRLTVEKTPAATWECGTWKNLNDQEIRERLTSTMDAFNKAKAQKELPSPVIELTYPIACFFPHAGLLNLQNLPLQTRFQIMDLPGKNNQDDQINGAVIQNCQKALSIVTYNMEETDEKLRKALMEEVLEQVKLMGGSPARMLFALNRIDVFRKDHEWESRTQDATKQTIDEIKEIISKRLSEHSQSVERLSYGKLCSLPALFAWQMKTTTGDIKIESANQINDHFGFMIPEELKDDLSRNVKKWNDIDYEKVQGAVWKSSYADSFFPILEKHIHDNFAKLIISPILVEFKGKVSEIINKLINTCTMQIGLSEEGHQAFKQKLNQDREKITSTLKQLHDELMVLPNNLMKVNNITANGLARIIKDTVESENGFYKGLEAKKLAPLHEASNEINNWLSGALEGAVQSLNQGKINFAGTQADYLSEKHQRELRIICENLMGKYYTPIIAQNGTSIKATSDEKKRELEIMQKSIENFSIKISDLMQLIYIEKSTRENSRIREALEEIMLTFINHVNIKMKESNFNLATHIPSSILSNASLQFSQVFEGHVSIEQEVRIESNPWLLWLSEREVAYASIPSTRQLRDLYIAYMKNTESMTLKPLIENIKTYFNKIDSNMKKYVESIIDDANHKFDKAFEENKKGYITDISHWRSLQAKSNEINNILQDISIAKAG